MESRNPDGPLEASVTRLHGFLTSVVSGPLIMPSEYRRIVFGDPEEHAWEDIDQARRAHTFLMRLNNEVAGGLMSGEVGVLLDQLFDPPDDEIFAEDWCRGYIAGMSLRETEWKPAIEDPAIADYFTPIFAIADPKETGLDKYLDDKKHYEETLDLLPAAAQAIYNWWREKFASAASPQEPIRRATPKISPNAACPCGSGKKFKRCCSPLRAT
jgi:yecA family protein